MRRLLRRLMKPKITKRPGTTNIMFPITHSWKRGEPERQEYFTFRNGLWYPVEWTASSGAETEAPASLRFSVLSWNIDFMRPEGEARMEAALRHLETLVSGKPDPSVVMLNEMTKSDLALIRRAEWVRAGYNVTDASNDHWESPSYGTCMLVPRSLPIESVFRVHYEVTSMQRDALFVDVALPRRRVLRLCTSHLESLVADPPKRPAQLAAAARFLHRAHAGVLAGDLNAIEDFDRDLHAQNGLRDAYLESGGAEGADDGMTWGHMSERAKLERFGLSRMDKILFCGGVRLLGFERFGMDVVVEDRTATEQLVRSGELEKPWVTDHLGVRAEFVVEAPEQAGEETTE